MAVDWAAVRALFPIVNRYAYLKNCAAGPVSVPVAEAMERYARRYAEVGEYKDSVLVESLRAECAALVRAHSDEIAFVQNTVTGINVVAQGIRWEPGDEVLVPEVEFPANYYPWSNLQHRGVVVRTVPEAGGVIDADTIGDAIGPRTRLVAVSSVQFANGYRIDLARLTEVCHARRVLVSVDAVQQVGCIPLDVKATGVDFLQCAAHKWILGPIGTGFLYCRRELIDSLNVAFVGHDSMVERREYLPYQWQLWPDARRFEPGVHNHGGLAGLRAAVGLLDQIGVDEIHGRVTELTDYLIDGLLARGCEILSPQLPGSRSGIVLFRGPRIDSTDLVAKLAADKVLTSERSGGVRVGPAFYNNDRDLDRLLNAVSG